MKLNRDLKRKGLNKPFFILFLDKCEKPCYNERKQENIRFSPLGVFPSLGIWCSGSVPVLDTGDDSSILSIPTNKINILAKIS